MNDKFSPTPLVKLMQIIINQYGKQKSIFGIPQELFFIPSVNDPFRLKRFGQLLESPIGVAAGPHTQLAQNIVAAWLCGARYMELKTIQTLDNLEVSKPCIDMQDEGYNCEWSQELKIKDSYNQYLDAWIIVHVLKHMLDNKAFNEVGTIFNMSVGYNLEGIKNENVQWFLANMQDSSTAIEERKELLQYMYPEIKDIQINPCISNNVTLSTMHGCPPDEIEKIGRYLLSEKKLHTTIKLNPTLLGKEQLNNILKQSGYETLVPDAAFEHDLKYNEARLLIQNLKNEADKQNLHFGLKLTNTLECINNKSVFPEKEKMMYMSGVPLHPIAISLADKIQHDFDGKLDISFSAGVDAFNLSEVIACDLKPATVCSDILKPGGYGRLKQYIDNLRDSFGEVHAGSIDDFIIKKEGNNQPSKENAALNNLWKYSISLKSNNSYQKRSIRSQSIKTRKNLNYFDCIHAPCESTCPTNQGIPDYMFYSANANFDKAKEIVEQTNPFPYTTGMVCDHVCESKCTRMNYDNTLLIREVKYAIAIHSTKDKREIKSLKSNGKKVGIIGAGPSGLSCAYFLAQAGFEINIYERGEKPGGMVSGVIPKFRLSDSSIETDMDKILSLGIKVAYNQPVTSENFETIRKKHDYIYVAAGAQSMRKLFIESSDNQRIIDPLEFLLQAKKNIQTGIGKQVLVIGGGNTAIDVARTAKRLVPKDGTVKLIYRRTVKQMPANEEEIKSLLDEKIEIQELVSPLRIKIVAGQLTGLICQKMTLGEKDASGREISKPIENSEFTIHCDTIIPALGQDTDIDFLTKTEMNSGKATYETKIPGVFIGGDALNGGVSAIAAIGDGRKVAQTIIDKEGIDFKTKSESERPKTTYRDLMIKKAKRIKGIKPSELPINQRYNFNLIAKPLEIDETISEASRCLLCDELCNICTSVCPNLALFAYQVSPFEFKDEPGKKLFSIDQSTQILHIADWCNTCGNCNTFCPTSGAPYEKKPHLYLNKSAFSKADDAYYFIFTDEEQTLLYRKGDEIHSFAENPINLTYITKSFSAQIEKETFQVQTIKYREEGKPIDLAKICEMNTILEAARQFFGVGKPKIT